LSWLEHCPDKAEVSGSSPEPPTAVAGSVFSAVMLTVPSRAPSRARIGAVAQLVERLLCKEKVRSSNLLGSTVSTVGVSSEVRRQGCVTTARRPDRVQPASDDCALEPGHVFCAARELERTVNL